ncbi:MAG: hypothetical protein IH794_07315 [Acidobacteria bacterium]|nr:hypothetical protein [Acidobacteriota bacterium]
MGAQLTWRLEGGYSRFIEGSRVELRLEKKPFRHSLDVSPSGLIHRSQPMDLIFRATRGFTGKGPGGVRWRVRPQGQVRSVILFAGNAFLGNFRVPPNHLAIQWNVEASTEGSAGLNRVPLLVDIGAKTRLYHSWVTLFPEETSIARALREAWRSYRNPLDPGEVLQMSEGQVVRWRWSGRVGLKVGVEWALGPGWVLPGSIPMLNIQKGLSSGASLGARVEVVEEGEFNVQVRKRAGKIEFRLRRHRQRTRQAGLSAGVHFGNSLRVTRLGPTVQGPLRILSKGLTEPLKKKMNRVFKQALVRRLEVAIALERTRWRSSTTLLAVHWLQTEPEVFRRSYGRLLGGSLPTPETGVEVTGGFERIRGQRVTVRFNVFNWFGFQKTSERQSRQSLRVSPAGDLVFEATEELEKTRYRWDEIQFLRLLHRETLKGSKRSREFLWSYGQEGEFSQGALRKLLKMALHMGVFSDFSLPGPSAFPLTLQLLVGTRFSPAGIRKVRQATPEQKWMALVRALEIADPERYGKATFWRDWIDHRDLRETIDEDPIQTHLATRYPIEGRTSFQRQQVVAAYRRSKRFLYMLEAWKGEDLKKLLKLFSLGLDMPIFVFFHLLCPPQERRSGAVLTGDWEQAWGEVDVLEDPDRLTTDSSIS